MEQERISLSMRERERLKVLQQVEEGRLKQIEAAKRLRVTDRHVRCLQQRLRNEGDSAIVHGLRGRRSNRKIAEALTQRALRQLRQTRYAGFGPTLAAEHLAGQGIEVSRETLRKWMSAAGLWQTRRRRVKQVHVWRPRRSCWGELVMMDSSPYRWLEDRGPAGHLIAMIDDATSRVWGRFVEHDSTEENLRTLGGWLERWGRPLALYTDKNSLFVTTRPTQRPEQLHDTPARTQFGRPEGWLLITPWSGMGSAGVCRATRSALGCVALGRKSNGGWTALTGFVFAIATSRSRPARPRHDPQVLPAYGL